MSQDRPGAPAPLHLVLGDDAFLTERATAAIVATLRASVGDAEPAPTVTRLDGPEVTAAALAEALSPSLFAEPQVVVVGSAADLGKDAQDAVRHALGDVPEETCLVVEHTGGGRAKTLVGDVRKAGAVEHPAAKISRPAELVTFVRAEFRERGVRAGGEVAETLVEAVGNDLRALAAACDQLVSDTGGHVDVAAVRRYHSGVVGTSGFTVAEKAVTGDAAGAAEALAWAVDTGVPHVVLADALADSVNTIVQVSARRGEPASELARAGIPPWKVRKASTQARGWDADRLGRALVVVARLNGEVKGGAEDSAFALERAVREVSALARG